MNTVLAIPLTSGAPPRPRPLIWHQIRKDLRRHRGVLLVWLGLLLGAAPALPVVQFASGGQWVAMAAVDFVVMALVARLVFEDPPAGPRPAFWLTLPLASETLWMARLTLLAGVVWLPLLVAQFVLMVFLAVPAAQWPLAMLQAALWEAGLILTSAVVATCVSGYLRLFGVMVMGIVVVLLQLLWHRWTAGLGGMEWIARGLDGALLEGLIALPALTAFGLLAVVYRARRHAVTPVVQVGGALALLVAWALMYDAIAMSHAVPLRHPPLDAAARALFDVPIRLEPGSSHPGEESDGRRRLAGDFVVPGLPRGCALSPARIRSRLLLSDGRVWSSSDVRPAWSYDRGTFGSYALFGLEEADSLTRGVTLTRPILTLPDDVIGRPAPDTRGVFTAEADIDGFRGELAPALPLRAGVTASFGERGFRIHRVDRSGPGHLRVVLSVAFTRPGRETPMSPHPATFAVRLPGHDQPIRLGGGQAMPAARSVTGLPILGLATIKLELDPDGAARLGLTGAAGELEGATLLIAREAYVGTATRHFRIEDFQPAAW